MRGRSRTARCRRTRWRRRLRLARRNRAGWCRAHRLHLGGELGTACFKLCHFFRKLLRILLFDAQAALTCRRDCLHCLFAIAGRQGCTDYKPLGLGEASEIAAQLLTVKLLDLRRALTASFAAEGADAR